MADKRKEGGIRSLADLNRDDDDEGRQGYYAGGSEKSGVQIQDPRDPRNNTNNIVNQLFEKAKQLSAEQEQKPAASAATQSNRVVKIITFWKNGFTVNDGPLRSYDDPRNQSFLNDIKEGYVPQELEEEAAGRQIYTDLVNKQHEEYKEPPKPKVIPFSGQGQTLGGPSSSAAPPPPTELPSEIVVDESKPTTTIQIRLADGTRLTGRFNHDHTILHVRAFIEKQKPQSTPYDLMLSFPAKVLSDYNQTLKDAGLLNAAITQKYR